MLDSRIRIVIWGAAGHAKVVVDALSIDNSRIEALFDNNPAASSPFSEVPLYIGEKGFHVWRKNHSTSAFGFIIAIGGNGGKHRLQLQEFLSSYGMIPLTVIHPTAFAAQGSHISKGCHVLGMSFVGAGASIGSQSIINTNASVDHECSIGSGVHVAPGATLAGCVRVDECAMIGAGAVVLPHVHIGAHALVGAGSVVTRNIPQYAVAYGNPARVVRYQEHE
jgi:sugar O-acyltransferase (sialic acid O-acetyltransferase NeuD family)